MTLSSVFLVRTSQTPDPSAPLRASAGFTCLGSPARLRFA